MSWVVPGYEMVADKPFDQGSFGTIWRARRRSDGLRVALKLVRSGHAEDARERMEAERHGAMLQRSFHDAHGMVPAVYDVGYDTDEDLYIAMEHVEGGALSEVIARGRLDPAAAARHAAAICRFLEKAHRFSTTIEGDHYDRLVHADLKPGHIFARANGEVIVLDFGIAKALDKSKPLTTNNWGTSAYMSPERLLDGRVDEHVDFWSLGVILYEMLAGHRPYRHLQAPSQKAPLERAIRGNAPREPLPASVPAALAAIVNKLLAYQPERRYPTAAAIRADLEAFLAGHRPVALDEYETPATARVGEAAEEQGASEATERRPEPDATERRPDAVVLVPSTDPLTIVPPPLPGAALASAASASAGAIATDAPAGSAAARRPRRRLRRFLRVAAIVILVLSGITELSGWVQAGRLREVIGTIDGPALEAAETSYERLASMGPLHLGVRWRVNRPLRTHLMGMAERVIEDYRSEQPSLTLTDWKHAERALRWALRIESDRLARARLELCEAHILRIQTRAGRSEASQAAYRRAIDGFREAARIDRDSFDPYLGLSRVAIYGLIPADVDLASSAMREAEKRGYTPGRRERALVGDGYLRRADTLRRDARTLSGEQRVHALERARDDYQGCIDAFEPIVGYGNATKNIEICKIRRDLVADDLDEEREKAAGDMLKGTLKDALDKVLDRVLQS